MAVLSVNKDRIVVEVPDLATLNRKKRYSCFE
jgi:hypothetical protein